MRQIVQKLTFAALFILGGVLSLQAQLFPVTVNAQVTNPPPIYFNNYADVTTINGPLNVQLLLSDITISNRQIQLKVSFEGNGIQFESAPVIVGAPPLFIDGGTPLNLGSAELGAYFQLVNIQGISPSVYANSIPEGSYQFCFEVFDFLTGNRLSSKTCARTVIFQNEPPFLIMPTKGQEFDASLPQNIIFQWTPRHINVTNVEYELTLVEVWDYQVDPQTAYLSSPPIFTTTTTNTRFLYGVDSPLLLENKRYAWRVQAKAKKGAEEIGLFKNQGYSEIFHFDFQMPCTAPQNISTEVKGIYKTNIYWDNATGDTNAYIVRYREANNPNAEWFSSKTTENWITLWDLKEGTTYEYQVSSECALGNSNFSQTDNFTTAVAEDEDAYYNCGISPDITLSNKEPISELLVGEVFKAGDFPVKVTEISGSNGRFTGKGKVTIPYLKNIGVAVKFSNILVNTDKALADGMVVTTYDPTMSNILDVNETIDGIKNIIDEVEDVFDELNGGDHTTTEVDFTIDPKKTIITEDEITIVGTNGETEVIDRDSADTYEIVGNEKVYRVDKEGKLEEVGTVAEGGSATASNTTGVSNSPTSTGNGSSVTQLATNDVQITFTAPNSTYGFDVVDSDYEKESYPKTTDADGNTVYPPHKAVVNNDTDTFLAQVTIKNPVIKIEDLIFKTLNGKEITNDITGDNEITITVAGKDGYRSEEVIVTYKNEEDKQVVVANFFIHHLTMHAPIKLGIVSVNNANTSGVAQSINEIYKKAGVEFQITENINFDITESTWDEDGDSKITYDGSGNFSNFPKELTKIYKAFGNSDNFDKKAYYILVTDLPTTNPIGGFMPKASQFGFVFTNGSGDETKSTTGQTAAHELGHGIFRLEHPFEGTGTKSSGTNWLMDYDDGDKKEVELSQVDWEQIGSEAINLNPINIFQDDEGNEYETDGHYSTVYLVCLMLGMDDAKAESIAKAAEAPDTIIHSDTDYELNDTWAEREHQLHTHSLTDGFHGTDELITALLFLKTNINDIETLGRLLHRYGDTYAHTEIENSSDWSQVMPSDITKKFKPWLESLNHLTQEQGLSFLTNAEQQKKSLNGKTLENYLHENWLKDPTDEFTMYGEHFSILGIIFNYTSDHAFSDDGSTPDYIYVRPQWYLSYVENLSKIIAYKFNLDPSRLDMSIFRRMVDFVSNPSRQCSMKGIIDFEISRIKNEKVFYIPVFYSTINHPIASADAVFKTNYYELAKESLNFTKEYMSEQGIVNIKVKEINGDTKKFNTESTWIIEAYEIRYE